METEFAIIGGGVVGLSVAYGLRKLGKQVTVFDEGDTAFRASRGNFGLVWVQSKGLNQPAYARWTRRSAAAWRDFSDELSRQTGEDLKLVQNGGYIFHLDEEELDAERKKYEQLKTELGGDYPFEVMGANALKREEPHIGPKVAGALFCAEDGHVNPLGLLRSLADAGRKSGVVFHVNSKVTEITPAVGGFDIRVGSSRAYFAEKVVLTAGLGAMQLGPSLGFRTPIRPQQGQVLITEKMPKLLNRPSVEIRQVDEGGIQIGATKAEIGLEDGETLQETAKLARHAIDILPALAKAKLVRSWAALRIMSPDGLPIYQRSGSCPGAYFITCHSGITLAAAHSEFLPKWITGEADAPDLSVFGEERFDVQAAQ
ncbi:NAD(P)/FAD-dependent oxidoreductase [Hoeflea sp. TYP-13]|uniref:NAD(P)/FAD-dependent oxidoreductase n=1 Tax=Hoeflea sp. TYP-13 TaxID=3230023 RepID=UPI0034C641C9